MPLGCSRSCPTLCHADPQFNLREYRSKRVKPERPVSQPHLDPANLTQADLIGGNGRWRQRKALVEFEQRGAKELELLREQRAKAEKLRKKQEVKEEKRKKQLEELRKERITQQERLRQDEEERQVREEQQAEKERLRKEEEHREWLARQPYECETCSKSGKCQGCDGSGQLFSLFLVSEVGEACLNEFGRMPQGCEDCGGQRQNLQGKLRVGSGKCSACGGHGMIWPIVESKHNRRALGATMSQDISPKSTSMAMHSPSPGLRETMGLSSPASA